MGKRHFDVAQPDAVFLTFDLKAQVDYVSLCPKCGYVVAVFFPYRSAGFGEHFFVEYVATHTVIREEHLTQIVAGESYECGHCFWDYDQAATVREPIEQEAKPMQYNMCRSCRQYEEAGVLIKYSTRHYIHARCAVEKWGDYIVDHVPVFELGRLPAVLLEEAGLTDLVRAKIAEAERPRARSS